MGTNSILLEHLDTLDQSVDRLIERLTRAKIAKLTQPLETKMQRALALLFKQQGRALLRKMGPIRTKLSETLADDFSDIFDDATATTSEKMASTIETGVNGAVLVGGRSIIRDFSVDLVFSLDNLRAVAYTKQHAAEAIKGIDTLTKATIRSLVITAASNGTSYSTLARQISNRFDQFAVGVPQRHIRSRAELIAVTEIGQGYQVGNYSAAHQIQDGGLLLEKYWSNKGDSRVSDGCIANSQAGWITLTDQFPSGHDHPLRFPGCRCAAQYRRAR